MRVRSKPIEGEAFTLADVLTEDNLLIYKPRSSRTNKQYLEDDSGNRLTVGGYPVALDDRGPFIETGPNPSPKVRETEILFRSDAGALFVYDRADFEATFELI